MKLTHKQKAFADYYIQTTNASESARKAGYSAQTADVIGYENLKKPQIAAYIGERLKEQDEKRVADANEVLAFYTSVMRGQEKDQFGLDASLADRIKAGVELMKRHAVAESANNSEIEDLTPLAEMLKK